MLIVALWLQIWDYFGKNTLHRRKRGQIHPSGKACSTVLSFLLLPYPIFFICAVSCLHAHHHCISPLQYSRGNEKAEEVSFHSLLHSPEGSLNVIFCPVTQYKPKFPLKLTHPSFKVCIVLWIRTVRPRSGVGRRDDSEKCSLIYFLLNLDCFILFHFLSCLQV